MIKLLEAFEAICLIVVIVIVLVSTAVYNFKKIKMKTGEEVFERSTGAKGRIVSLHDNSVYVLFSNGRRAMLDKSEITLTVEQGTENVIKWLWGTGKKLQRTVDVSILKFMELPLYAVVTISTILLLLGAGITFLLSMF